MTKSVMICRYPRVRNMGGKGQGYERGTPEEGVR